jgi:dipeptidyl aminopeptidase/acylaminoacyl peptidase
MHLRRLWLAVALCLGSAWSAALADAPPLSVEDALDQRTFGIRIPIDVSPDGQWVAYTLEVPGRRRPTGELRFFFFSRTGAPVEALGCDVWLTNIRTGESKNLTQGQGTSWAPVWSPDGRSLAFCSDRDGQARVWLWERDTGKLRPVCDAVVRPLFGFEVVRWSPDGKHLLMKLLPEDLSVESAADLISGPPPRPTGERGKSGVTVTVYRSPAATGAAATRQPESHTGASWTNRYLADLALIDVASGEVRRLARRHKPLGFWFSPDGRQVAFTSFLGIKGVASQQPLYDLHVIRLSDGADRVVAARLPLDYGITVSWSPDGKRLAYVTAGPNSGGECYSVAADGGEPVRLGTGRHPPFDGDYRPPLWDAEGRWLYVLGGGALWKVSAGGDAPTRVTRDWARKPLEILTAGPGRVWSPDGGRSVVVAARDEDTKEVGFYRVDLATGRPTPLWEGQQSFSGGALFTCRVTPDGKAVVYAAEDARHPADLWVADADFRSRRRLTRINPHLERYALGDSRLVRWRGLDGEVLRGALLLPAGHREGRRYPMVVKVYAGADLSNSVSRFGLSGTGVENMQLLASRGYAVLLPDSAAPRGHPMFGVLKTVMPGVDRVVQMGIADPERLGVMGHSYGGYSTLALLVQTTRFKAAVVSAGIGDLVSEYGQLGRDGDSFGIGWAEEGQGGMGGPPWQHPQRYLENSPVFYLDRVTTPVLLIHGALDEAVPAAQAAEVFVGLRRLGKEVVYARYEGEEHWQGTWGRANVEDYWSRVVEWFDSHLGPRGAK